MNKKEISKFLYLNSQNRNQCLFNNFDEKTSLNLWKQFYLTYGKVIEDRGSLIIITDKEHKIMKHLFYWCISSPKFNGDLRKGIYLAAAQGFGKDVLLKTIVEFFMFFNKSVREYSFNEFNMAWYSKQPYFFNGPIKINDLTENAKVHKERLSFPIVEFLDHREITNNRRGLLVSSNFAPKILQDKIEYDSPNPRLNERAKECFNIVLIQGSNFSKRIESKVEL